MTATVTLVGRVNNTPIERFDTKRGTKGIRMWVDSMNNLPPSDKYPDQKSGSYKVTAFVDTNNPILGTEEGDVIIVNAGKYKVSEVAKESGETWLAHEIVCNEFSIIGPLSDKTVQIPAQPAPTKPQGYTRTSSEAIPRTVVAKPLAAPVGGARTPFAPRAQQPIKPKEEKPKSYKAPFPPPSDNDPSFDDDSYAQRDE